MDNMPEARHDLLTGEYKFGSIQTTRGCPLSCIFCSVSAFNGRGYRTRPIDKVIHELKNIKEKYILIVDDNLIGINRSQVEHAKELFREIIKHRFLPEAKRQINTSFFKLSRLFLPGYYLTMEL